MQRQDYMINKNEKRKLKETIEADPNMIKILELMKKIKITMNNAFKNIVKDVIDNKLLPHNLNL